MPTTPPLEKSKRATIHRWLMILDSLRHDHPPRGYRGPAAAWKANATQFAAAFECSEKTIQRDFKDMRKCGYKLDYLHSEHRYVWTNKESMESLPLMAATEDEVISLLTAVSISRSVLDSGTEGHLSTFLNKLEQHIQGGFLHGRDHIEQTLHYKQTWVKGKSPTPWTKLQRAILDQRAITIDYASPHEGNEAYTRKLIPLLLAHLEGNWYLYAVKRESAAEATTAAIRLYRLSRIQRIRVWKFTEPEGFDRKALLKQIDKGVGAWQGGEVESVVLRIAGIKIDFMRERVWPEGHRFSKQADGSWLLTFEIAQTEHLVPFILSWAPDIEVQSPEHLREEVAHTARLAARLHGLD